MFHPTSLVRRARALAPVLATVGLLAFATRATSADNKTHGATAMPDQQAALDKLTSAAPNVPTGVDPIVWKSAVGDNPPSAARVALGKKLYFETALSKDGTVACATCHDVTRSFTDRRPVSEGVGDQLGRRNAPTTMNAALLHSQFLDGRATSLEDQAGQPILNSVEMAMPNEAAAVAALERKGYGAEFKEVFGHPLTYADIRKALAAFERTLMFLDAPFDRFLAGDTSAISGDARAGWMLFNGKARCATCHTINLSNPLGTDNRMHNIGVSARHQDFEQLATKALGALRDDPSRHKLDELAIATNLSELGRFMVTRNEADIGAFRTSQLRNVGVTAPYMHDGSLQTLWDTIDHYNKGGEANHYLDGGIEPLALTEPEINQLVAFLFTLTDSRFAKLNGDEQQRQHALADKQRPFRDDELALRKVISFGRRPEDKRPPGGVK